MNKEFIGDIDKYKYYNEDRSKIWLSYDLKFYQYSDSWFTGGGTAFFIENEEDNGGGFSDNTLADHHRKDQIAQFEIGFCENDTVNYYATLTHYQNDREIKIDTLLSKCVDQQKKIIPEIDRKIYSTEVKATTVDYPTVPKNK